MRPLEGIRILDLTRLLPGPFCAWLLRNWGARTIKVEDPRLGDYMREMKPVWYAHLNAGAESVALDLRYPAGRAAFLRLAADADMVLEGFRPGVMERLGLSLAALQEVNPRLVLVSLAGFGPDDAQAGHDLTYLARSGILSLSGEVPPLPWADLSGALSAAAGALAALHAARATGRGTHVQTSLFDALMALASPIGAAARAGHRLDRTTLPLAGALPCYTIYDTADGGRVALAALEPKFWAAFCAAVDRPEWVDRGWDTEFQPQVAALFRSRSLAAWAALAASAGDICLEPVVTIAEAFAQREPLQPVRFGGETPMATGPAPGRGEQTRQILREAGLTEQEIEAMAAEAVIPPP